MSKKQLEISDVLALVIVFSLILSLPLFIWALLTQRFQLEKSAQTAYDSGEIYLHPTSKTAYVGDLFPVNVMFHTGSPTPNTISSLSLRVTYPYNSNIPELLPVDASGSPITKLAPNQDLLLSGEWSFPVNQITIQNGLVVIDLAAINTSTNGYTSANPLSIATFYLSSEALTNGPVALNFDQTQSLMMTKEPPVENILNLELQSSMYEVAEDNVGPEAITDFEVIDITAEDVTFQWTSPVDSGPEGQSEGSMIVMNTVPITEQNWDSSVVLGGHQSYPVGTVETLSREGVLDSSTTYYFAIKTFDSLNNYSDISNVVEAKSLPSTISDFSFDVQAVTPNSTTTRDIFYSISLSNSNFSQIYSYQFIVGTDGYTHSINDIVMNNLPVEQSGTQYEVFVKNSSHLRKRLGQKTFYPGQNTGDQTWLSQVVLAGDFNNDNVLSINDIGLMLSEYTALTVPVNSTNQIYDIDYNDVINISDIAQVLSNYNQLEVQGD